MKNREGDRLRVFAEGKDARTHAIVRACRASRGNPWITGLTELNSPGVWRDCAEVIEPSLVDMKFLREVVERVRPDLAIIGPEEPLAEGAADVMAEYGIPTFGPPKELAAIESSKSWARGLLDRHDISGNPEYRVFHAVDGMLDYMRTLGDFVVKPDGLTGGKGVRVFGEHLHSLPDAAAYGEE